MNLLARTNMQPRYEALTEALEGRKVIAPGFQLGFNPGKTIQQIQPLT